MLTNVKEARAFEISGADEALLLIHGFTGTPAEVLPIGERISKRFGWHIRGPLLPGHGTTAKELNKTTWQDWFEHVKTKWLELNQTYETCHVLGLSMGALLALELTRQFPQSAKSLGMLVPPVWLRPAIFRYGAPLLQHKWINSIFPYIPKGPPMEGHITYRSYPPKAVGELEKISRRARTFEGNAHIPAFICTSEKDRLVDPQSGIFLKRHFPHKKSQYVHLKHSGHVVTLDLEKDLLLDSIESFYTSL